MKDKIDSVGILKELLQLAEKGELKLSKITQTNTPEGLSYSLDAVECEAPYQHRYLY